ncbi:V4R domain-containing protein [Tuwongella immobilis]|uniref:4-vinyl reductase 4VR domain-containing protein n=1 Tax=Tuwongella immobilis TaxID=692036 RepID=A0A6C2YPX8_9BACT|nr:V4R domain-containing protein [Tuwongella immobilis]VIP03526.1 4-vinyl reductase 4VR OS=Isosphaera pallida (strain ATCC 43644 / DSM 9630 / IS1B) GN=Isop_2221 PE=4 SV=1: V4R [Tuwongella immobilis]VTS04420.1 4-vinyl reductase 4VR OS=Isosphaera pallida (strain ATCC 43644 / DSM 9630 / IS1B) GN=Isop_2221 PE=4 SV=1: V4R [Tuwongella immobilis]
MTIEQTLLDSKKNPPPETVQRTLQTVLKFLRTEANQTALQNRIPAAATHVRRRHNYYYDEKFFEHDPKAGIVRNVYGQRVVRVSEDFITGLLAGLEEEVGEAAGEIMYKAGYQWGLEDMASFVPRVQAEFLVQFEKMSMGMMLESWWWPLQIEGWGAWRYDFRQHKQGLIFIDLYESAVAQSLGDVGKVVCYFYAGMFAAVFSVLARRELAGIEIQCYSMGEDYCKFLISTAKRVNAAAFWRNEGATSKDILKKLSTV